MHASSPHEELNIRNDVLLELAVAVDRLSIALAQELLVTAAEQERMDTLIKNSVILHLRLPTVKGSGHGNIEHLVSAYAHSAVAELSDKEHFQVFLNEHVSMTTDLGTESGLCSFMLHDVAGAALSCRSASPARFSCPSRKYIMVQVASLSLCCVVRQCVSLRACWGCDDEQLRHLAFIPGRNYIRPPPPSPPFRPEDLFQGEGGGGVYFEAPRGRILYAPPLLYAPHP